MDWMQDIECFLRQFHDILEGSAMHIYHSALPFTPSSSLIRKHFAKELENEVQIIHGQPQSWDHSSRALALDADEHAPHATTESAPHTAWHDPTLPPDRGVPPKHARTALAPRHIPT